MSICYFCEKAPGVVLIAGHGVLPDKKLCENCAAVECGNYYYYISLLREQHVSGQKVELGRYFTSARKQR